MFLSALDRMPSDSYNIVIKADRTPQGQHAGRYNAPNFNDMGIIINSTEHDSRDIVIFKRSNNSLERISETHRSYDALQ